MCLAVGVVIDKRERASEEESLPMVRGFAPIVPRLRVVAAFAADRRRGRTSTRPMPTCKPSWTQERSDTGGHQGRQSHRRHQQGSGGAEFRDREQGVVGDPVGDTTNVNCSTRRGQTARGVSNFQTVVETGVVTKSHWVCLNCDWMRLGSAIGKRCKLLI